MEIRAVGGYNDIGKNCTAVKVGKKCYLLDMGIHLEKFIQYTEDEKLLTSDSDELMNVGAVPNLKIIEEWKNDIEAILPSHAHLDHIGGITLLSSKVKAQVIATPYTIEVLKALFIDQEIKMKERLKATKPDSTVKINDEVSVEFIHTTHSTPNSAMVALHTKEGIVLYANDFKFDNTPTLEKKPNYKRLEELGKQGVLLLIADSTYADSPKKMESEAIAKQMLEDTLLNVDSKGKAIIITTFSSHIARLKAIVECAKKMRRKPIFLGRSLHKYVSAAENVGLVDFSKDVEIIKYPSQMRKALKKIEQKKDKYLLVVTGHQGEPQSTLSKMAKGKLRFNFEPGDHVIFSCKTIPTETNKKNRERLENELKARNLRLFLDIHVSGHAAREDLRDLLKMVRPKHLMPSHGDISMRSSFASLAEEMGYTIGKNVHLLKDGDSLKL